MEYCFNIKSDAAYSGIEAVKMVEARMKKLHKFGCSEYYKLILTDINMPEMDGIQMTRRIRELYSESQKHNIGTGEINNNFMLMLNSGISSESRIKKENPCIIWAITAMNETEIEDMIGEKCLDGISTKPMSKDALGKILSKYGFINNTQK